MENQVTNNENALRLFFTEEVFLVADKSVEIPSPVYLEPVLVAKEVSLIDVKEGVKIIESAQIPSVKVVEEVKHILKEVEKTHIIDEPLSTKTYKFLGGNKKSVLILVNDNLNGVSTEQGRELLRKIVKAVELGTPDFAVVNYAHYLGTSFLELHEFFKPLLMLSFGVEISDLKLDLVWENEIIIHETTRIIFAPNLHHLEEDNHAKKMLWKNLQKIK